MRPSIYLWSYLDVRTKPIHQVKQDNIKNKLDTILLNLYKCIDKSWSKNAPPISLILVYEVVTIAMTSNNYQLATPLRVQVAPGPLDEGSRVPPEETIWKEHQLSRGTVRKAIGLQLQEGLITRNQGRGTFIMPPPHYRPISVCPVSARQSGGRIGVLPENTSK